jgi:hypothetical protein
MIVVASRTTHEPCGRRPVGSACWPSGVEYAGGDSEAGGGGGEPGLILAVGDLSGDLAELGGDRRFASLGRPRSCRGSGGARLRAGRARSRCARPAAADVGDVGLHPPLGGAGAGGASDALLKSGGAHGRSKWVRTDAGCRLWPSCPICQRQRTVTRRRRRALEQLELGALDLPVADVRLEPLALSQSLRELAQAPDALGPGRRSHRRASASRPPIISSSTPATTVAPAPATTSASAPTVVLARGADHCAAHAPVLLAAGMGRTDAHTLAPVADRATRVPTTSRDPWLPAPTRAR